MNQREINGLLRKDWIGNVKIGQSLSPYQKIKVTWPKGRSSFRFGPFGSAQQTNCFAKRGMGEPVQCIPMLLDFWGGAVRQ
jgi:hypothetical protein